ncbi:MAG TPA: O-acetyl-ADP-ribose deacetylase [Myxococcaceae bacterium]|nr:O-acetyl-ADP-ribose deacetylase [Myxococcaceae bacterium]
MRRMGAAMIELVRGDITRQQVDAIVNAANSGLMGGGGVDGAIHRAGGPSILEECKILVAQNGRCPTGGAVITGAGNLPARYVIHAVGPRYGKNRAKEAELLAAAYSESMRLATQAGCESIAFPAISTGAYGYPLEEAAAIALAAVRHSLSNESSIKRVLFVLFADDAMQAFEKAMADLQ